jgi:beta-galactosidase/beta-glucuronidase
MPDDVMVLQMVVGPEQSAPANHQEASPENRISLDGVWDFLHLIEDYRSPPVYWRSILVPGPWQAQFADLRMRAGTGIYRRDVEIPSGWKRNRIFLKFGAVFHVTRAWLNGELAGLHIGGFLPFSFDVTEQLVEGVNEIKVRERVSRHAFCRNSVRKAKLVRPAFRDLAVGLAGAARR